MTTYIWFSPARWLVSRCDIVDPVRRAGIFFNAVVLLTMGWITVETNLTQEIRSVIDSQFDL